MPTMHCAYGTCHSDSRKKDLSIKFVRFPKPEKKTMAMAKRWLHLCGREGHAVMCLWRLLFSENIFWQIHTHKASFRWTVVMCFCKWPLSGILFWQNWYSHVNSSATTVRCTVERERERLRKWILVCKIEGVHASKYCIFVQGYIVMI